jgi:hypothetical protein
MADSITLVMDGGKANRTGLDPSNSGTIGTTAGARHYIYGPPTDGHPFEVGIWEIQAYGTQTDSQSLTAATYQFVDNQPYYTVAPTSYSYVSLGL